MTTNDATYYARRGRLRDASKGATVTIPDGWEPPADAEPEEQQLVPGDRFTNDGSGDGVPWTLDDAARARLGFGSRYWGVDRLARLGLDVDPADDDQDDTTTATGEDQTAIIAALDALPVGSTLTFDEPRDFTPGADRAGIHNRFRITGLTRREDEWDAPGVHTEIPDWTANVTLHSRHLPGLGVTAADFPGGITVDDDSPFLRRTGRNGGETPPRITYNHVHVGNLGTSKVWVGHAGSTPPADGDLEAAGFKPLGWIDADGIAVDPAPASDDPECCGCEECGKLCPGCSVHLSTDETDDDGKALRYCACPACNPDADDDEYHLDDYQRERVAALHEALMILEVRRSPETTDKARSFGDVFAPTGRPMVKPTDLINVAAFIADGTIPGGGQA